MGAGGEDERGAEDVTKEGTRGCLAGDALCGVTLVPACMYMYGRNAERSAASNLPKAK